MGRKSKRKDKRNLLNGLKRMRGSNGKFVSLTNKPRGIKMSRKLTMMRPDSSDKTTVSEYPTIVLSEKAHVDISLLVSKVETEVGWFGMVDFTDKNEFYIYDIIIPEQQCHGATTEMEPRQIFDAFQAIIAEDAVKKIPLHESRVRKVRYWGHSHVNGPVNPSGQDDKQMTEFGAMNVEYMIRGIHNKKGDTRFDVYYYRNGKTMMQFNHVGWKVEATDDRFKERSLELDELIKAKVHGFTSPIVHGYSGSIFDSDSYGLSNWSRYNHSSHKTTDPRSSDTDYKRSYTLD